MTANSSSKSKLTKRLAWTPLLLVTSMLGGIPVAVAQEATSNSEEIIVTATKRSESIQDVPMSIQAIGTERLEELNVSGFNDYAQFLPSLTYQSLGPGFARTFMRGVASGDNGNHSGPLPSVGIYLDEQPVSTITGALDIHVYDIARVEALAGPQGTLYGASSLAGTVRIITNQPDPSGFSGAFSVEANTIDNGGSGYVGEGYVNIPLSPRAAIRLVGWSDHEGGYIDNVEGTRDYATACGANPNDGTCVINNAAIAEDDYNPVDTYGARAALRIDLNDNWTITPAIMGQRQESEGLFAFDPNIGDLEVSHFLPENAQDEWYQAALTINGHISNLDVTYAGAFMRRAIDSQLDYTDYSFFYDQMGYYIYDETGVVYHDPSQAIRARDRFTKESHELRIATPGDAPLRFIGGLFYQRQVHDIEQRYVIAGMFDDDEVPGWDDTVWLTEQDRIDRDWAAFGQLSYDFTDRLTGTVGLRAFKSHNTLIGFFGYGAGFSSGTGEAACFDPTPFEGAPCINLDRGIEEEGTTHSVNLTYDVTPDIMVYGTWSTGFRPGGVNRRIFQTPFYSSDTLVNYELGIKSDWAQGRFRFNAAIFQEEWQDFQFSFLGENGLTEVRNAGDARIRGIEADLTWRPMDGLTFTAAATAIDSEILQNYCSLIEVPDPDPWIQTTDCPSADSDLLAPSGTQLPVTPDLKADLTARYEFNLMGSEAYWQAAIVHQSGATQDLRTSESAIIGSLPAYTSLDLSAGFDFNQFSLDFFLRNATDERGELYRYTECQIAVCGAQYYVAPIHPRTFAVRLSRSF